MTYFDVFLGYRTHVDIMITLMTYKKQRKHWILRKENLSSALSSPRSASLLTTHKHNYKQNQRSKKKKSKNGRSIDREISYFRVTSTPPPRHAKQRRTLASTTSIIAECLRPIMMVVVAASTHTGRLLWYAIFCADRDAGCRKQQ